jgi:hypothetical protein
MAASKPPSTPNGSSRSDCAKVPWQRDTLGYKRLKASVCAALRKSFRFQAGGVNQLGEKRITEQKKFFCSFPEYRKLNLEIIKFSTFRKGGVIYGSKSTGLRTGEGKQ